VERQKLNFQPSATLNVYEGLLEIKEHKESIKYPKQMPISSASVLLAM